MVEPEPTALHRALGPELGAMFADLHREHGVEFRFGESVSELRGPGGSVGEVITSSGAELPADIVVVGIGAVPNTRPGRRRRPGGGQRDGGRRGAAHLRPGHLRRR